MSSDYDREQLERELAIRMQELAPTPASDALQRATARVAATQQRYARVARLAGAVGSRGWARAGATAAVVAAALVVGVVIGRTVLPIATGPVGSSTPPWSQAPVNQITWDEPSWYMFVWEGCSDGTAAGRFLVTVEERHVVAFEGIEERSKRLEGTFDLRTMPTIGYMIGRANEALGRTEPLDLGGRPTATDELPSVRYETDPVDGHPTRIDIDWVPEAIDDEECYVITEYALAPFPPSDQAEIGWQEPRHYTFVFEASCGLRVLHGRFRAYVADGVTYRYEALDERAGAFPFEPEDIPTLGEMLARANEALLDAQSSVELVTDPVDGHPVHIDIDWIVSAIDEEECYEILRYEPVAPGSSPTN